MSIDKTIFPGLNPGLIGLPQFCISAGSGLGHDIQVHENQLSSNKSFCPRGYNLLNCLGQRALQAKEGAKNNQGKKPQTFASLHSEKNQTRPNYETWFYF